MRDQRHAPAALYPGKDPVPTVQEAGWAPGPVWTGAENLAPTGIRSPDRPARSQSLYRLSYRAHAGQVREYYAFLQANSASRAVVSSGSYVYLLQRHGLDRAGSG